MKIVETREPVKPVLPPRLEEITITLSRLEVECIKSYAQRDSRSLHSFTWYGSNILEDLIRAIKQVEL